MSILLLLYPQETPEPLAGISLAVVFFNALSGSVAYARMKRIGYRSGLLFSAATIPGAILGALTTPYMPRRLFDGIFGLLLIAVSVFLFVKPGGREEAARPCPPNHRACTVTEADGHGPSFLLSPAPGGRREHGGRLSLQPVGHRRGNHPRARADTPVEFSGTHRYRDLPVYPDQHGADGNADAYRNRRLYAGHSPHHLAGRRCFTGRATGDPAFPQDTWNMDHPGACIRLGGRWGYACS